MSRYLYLKVLSLLLRKKDKTEKMDFSSIGVITKLDSNQVDDKLIDVVIDYFTRCNFEDKLLVDLRPTSDDFESGNIDLNSIFLFKRIHSFRLQLSC